MAARADANREGRVAAAAAQCVVLVGPLPPPPGGIANQTRQLGRLLGTEGVDVRTVRTNEPLRPGWLESLRGLRGVLRLVALRRELARTLCEGQVVHVMANSGWAWFLFAAPAIRAAARRGLPVLVNYRGGLAETFLARSGRRVIPTLKQASALVVPSRFLQEVFARHGMDAAIIPNIVDLDVFHPVQPPNAGSGRSHVVITRSLETIYGIDTAIRAAAIVRRALPQLRLSIAGSGPEREPLARLVAELGLGDAVRFTGRLEVPQVAALYAEADLALNPSRVDNTPNSLLEAAACGLPIVSTNVGGVPHLVEHGRTAWLVEPDSPEQMARGIERVLGDAALRATLREQGLALARSCAWGAVGSRWLALYDELARHAGGAVYGAAAR